MNSLPNPSPLASYWNLSLDIVFLNHGSFGANPKYITDKQKEYIDMLEAEPVDFSVRKMYSYYQESKKSLSEFVGTNADNIYFVTNTTIGINHVLYNQDGQKGEWLTTNHAYGACLHAFQKIASLKSAEVIKVNIPFPLQSENDILSAIESGITPKTKLAMIDYITSSSAIIFPIQKIIQFLRSKNIISIVDAAHAPGMVDLNIDELEPDFLVGNCHKWICSPKGSAFVYVHPKHQANYKPVYYSFYNDFDEEKNAHWSNQFIWEGTRDYSPYLCVKDAIAYLPTLVENGWQEIQSHNRDLAIQASKYIAEKLEVALPVPESMLGSIVNIPLWDDIVPNTTFNYYTKVKLELYNNYRIEVPCVLFPKAPTQYIRISAQLYNTMEQYEYLADCLLKIRG